MVLSPYTTYPGTTEQLAPRCETPVPTLFPTFLPGTPSGVRQPEREGEVLRYAWTLVVALIWPRPSPRRAPVWCLGSRLTLGRLDPGPAGVDGVVRRSAGADLPVRPPVRGALGDGQPCRDRAPGSGRAARGGLRTPVGLRLPWAACSTPPTAVSAPSGAPKPCLNARPNCRTRTRRGHGAVARAVTSGASVRFSSMNTSDAPAATVTGTGYASFVSEHAPGRARNLPGPRAAEPRPELPPHTASPTASKERTETPMYGDLIRLWAARGSTLPGVPDPEWHRLISYWHHQEETERTLRILHLQKSTPIG